MHGVSEPTKRALTEVGIEVALKTCFPLSSVFRKPEDVVCDEKKCGLVYEIPCRDCDAVYVGETGRILNTRKKRTREGCERDEPTKVRFMSTYCNLQWRTLELSMGGVLKLKLGIMTSYSYLCEDIKIQTEYFNMESLC